MCVYASIPVCSSTFSIVSLPHGWVYASQHTHGATHVCWNPLHPLTIRPNTRGEIHAVATKETMHGAIDIFLLTRCSLQKRLKSNLPWKAAVKHILSHTHTHTNPLNPTATTILTRSSFKSTTFFFKTTCCLLFLHTAFLINHNTL